METDTVTDAEMDMAADTAAAAATDTAAEAGAVAAATDTAAEAGAVAAATDTAAEAGTGAAADAGLTATGMTADTEPRRSAREYLEGIPVINRRKSPLPVVREFLGLLGNPDRAFAVIHVAGTNGKGSVCVFLSSCFREAGVRVGTFVSPHLVDIRERFLLDGKMVSEAAFGRAFETVREAAVRWQTAGNLHPTYFEFLFYMGLVLFREAGVRVLILETGMGGLYDVTNVVENPLVSVITSISIDHTAFLGKTIPEIAVHKAGIIKAGCPVVYDASDAEAERVIRERAGECGSAVIPVRRGICESETVPGAGKLLSVPDVTVRICESGEDFLVISLPFAGKERKFRVPFCAPYQAVNAALALTAFAAAAGRPEIAVLLKEAGDPERNGAAGRKTGTTGAKFREAGKAGRETLALLAAEGIRKTRWAARMERIAENVYLDGAHNEGGIRAFLDAACRIRELRRPEKTWLLFAVSSDKEYPKMLAEIAKRLAPDEWLLTAADSARALSEKELRQAAEAAVRKAGSKAGSMAGSRARIRFARGTADAVHAMRGEMKRRDLAFIVGSLYLAGEVKEAWLPD